MQSLKFFGAVTFAVGSFSLSNPYQYPNMLLMGQRSLPKPSPSPSPSPGPRDPGGTASRGDCDGVLVSLTPSNPTGSVLTQNPTISIDVRYEPSTSVKRISGTFTLERRTDGPLEPPFSQSITLRETSGKQSIPISPLLQESQWYIWYFTLECPQTLEEDRSNRYSQNLGVRGRIRREGSTYEYQPL